MKPLHIVVAIAIVGLWGLNFSVIKLGLEGLDPFLLTGLRFLLAAFPMVFFIRRPNVSWFVLASYGFTFGVGVWGLLTLSIDVGLSAGMASLLLQSSAFISVLFGLLFFHEKLSLIRLSGLIISIVGVSLIVTVQDGSVTTAGIILALLAALSLSLVSLIVKKAQIKNMFAFVVWSCLFAPLPLFIMSWVVNGTVGFSESFHHFSSSSLFSVIFQAYPVTLLGYWGWNKLVALYPMSTMAPIMLLVPFFGLLSSVVFYNEQVGITKIIACFMVLAGISVSLLENKIMSKYQKIKMKEQYKFIE